MNATLPALILGFVNAVLQMVVAFGVTISDQQNAAITAVVNAALVLGVSLYHLLKAERQPPAVNPSHPSPVV